MNRGAADERSKLEPAQALRAQERFVQLLDPAAVYRGAEQYFFVGPLHPPTLPGIRALTLAEICDSWRDLASDIRAGTKPELLNLYLHIPFCQHRCSYCIFHGEIGAEGSLDAYLDQVAVEMDLLAQALDGLRFKTCYIGGGTPTILSESQTATLLDRLDARFARMGGGQWSFECNPLSVTEGKAALFAAHGFNHVNVGVQTLTPRVLKRVNRAYQDESLVDRSLDILIRHRFFTNVDLLHGLPGETLDTEVRTFERILARGPHRITVYNLSPATPADSRGPSDLTALAERVFPLAERAGYCPSIDTTCIDVSLDDKTSRLHDELAATGERVPYDDTSDLPYSLLGLGWSARSYLYGRMTYLREPLPLDQPLTRDHAVARGRALSTTEEHRRFVTKRLANEGVVLQEYRDRFGETLESRFGPEVEALEGLGLLTVRDGRLLHTGTDPARRFSAELFFVEPERIEAALAHIRAKVPPSIERVDWAPQVRLRTDTGNMELAIALAEHQAGDSCYHHHGGFAFMIPRPADPAMPPVRLGPFEETLVRAFAKLFDRLIDRERPASVEALRAGLLRRGRKLVLTTRTPQGPVQRTVIMAPVDPPPGESGAE